MLWFGFPACEHVASGWCLKIWAVNKKVVGSNTTVAKAPVFSTEFEKPVCVLLSHLL